MRARFLAALPHWLRQHQWRWWEWGILAVTGVILLLFILLPGFLRREIISRLTAATTADVSLADVDVNLLRGRLTLQNLTFTLKGEKKPVIAVQKLVGNLRLLALLHGQVSVEEILLSGLQVVAVQHANGQLNLTRLFPAPPPGQPPAPPSDLPTLTIEHVGLSAVQVEYQDVSHTPPAHFTVALEGLVTNKIGLQKTGLAAPIELRLHGTLNGGSLQSETQVFWQRSQTAIEASLEVKQLLLTAIEPYLRNSLTLQNLAGQADAHLHYRYRQEGRQPQVHALEGTLALQQVSFTDALSGQRALELPDGQVKIDKIDLLKREIQLATLELHQPKLLVLQTTSGVNWVKVLNHTDQAAQQKPPAETEKAWRFSVQEVLLKGGEVAYRDSAWPETEAVSLVPEEVQLQHLSSEMTEAPFRFRLQFAEGILTGDGGLRFAPFAIHSQVQLSEVKLAPLQSLFSHVSQVKRTEGKLNGTLLTDLAFQDGRQAVTLAGTLDAAAFTLDGLPGLAGALSWEAAHFALREGSTLLPLNLGLQVQLSRLSLQHLPAGDVAIEETAGDLQLSQAEGTTTQALPAEGTAVEPLPSSLKMHGSLEVKSFLFTQGPDKQEVLSSYQVRAKLQEGSSLLPLDLRLASVELEYPYAQGFRSPDGWFQLAKPSPDVPAVVTSTAVDGPVPQSSQATVVSTPPPPVVSVERVTLTGGQLYFEDHAIIPAQTIYWQDIRVSASDVHYPLARPATFSVHAFNMDGAPIEAQGSTERQGDQLVTRVHGTIDHLTLARFNAYLAPHLGYRVRTGAVSVKWELMLPGDLIQANAAVTLHDLGLSGKESTSALEEQVGLSMSLIIALLKDLNGNINLQLPVEGRVSEPGFHFGGTMWRAVRDVLIGAITSPLKLLGAVFQGKGKIEEFVLEPIGFVPGTSQPTAGGKNQLARLQSFLAQRPELDVNLNGSTGEEDRRMLRDGLVLAQLQEQTPSPATTDTASAAEEGAEKISPQEEIRLFLTHRLNPSDTGGVPTLSAPAGELLTQLREKTTVPAQTLTQLAHDRVQTVITTLTAKSNVAVGRFRVAPDKLRSRKEAEVQYMIQAREKQ